MSDAGRVPIQVADARRAHFNIGITAFLFCPEVEGFMLTGIVYFDKKNRFKDGRRIRTSVIVEFVDQDAYAVALTSTGSAYVLVPQSTEELPLDLSRRVEH
ncbi:hypothetical protein V2K54_13315 [Pseudomonas alliivorans]|uniref:hypothetical protein n=1 Tax=Pseudomonas syringae TaxID=317 RepID=UPI00076096E3|nr:hypothetical protein [Pseudomonas syringae]MEE4957063.1 hypothetical protein [Pseudomonas alliivorans]KWS17198.1 hypothetical protein AL064_26085 [Pseudomonas syringae pv. syringae]MEE4965751.1 hypothetical protein [Pseudomonas alliivorans]MEE4988007.1 hypothetical protein [Pseudomonas alliivorans]MEE4992483.1 hypothetical protein [Pseudomonas alliivorans]